MDLERLTLRSQQAVAEARSLAASRHHPAVDPAHLLHALLSDTDGVVFPVVQRLGTAPGALRDRVDELLNRLPRAYTPSAQTPGAPPATVRVIERASEEARALTDEYVSTEHLLAALAEVSGPVATLLREHGVTRDAVLRALVEIRGNQRVSSQTPEETYQALERYGRDLTELARRGESSIR